MNIIERAVERMYERQGQLPVPPSDDGGEELPPRPVPPAPAAVTAGAGSPATRSASSPRPAEAAPSAARTAPSSRPAEAARSHSAAPRPAAPATPRAVSPANSSLAPAPTASPASRQAPVRVAPVPAPVPEADAAPSVEPPSAVPAAAGAPLPAEQPPAAPAVPPPAAEPAAPEPLPPGMPVLVGHREDDVAEPLAVRVPVTTAALHRSTRRTTWIGVIILLVSVGGLAAWATLAPLTSAVVAQGVVSLAGGRQIAQHLEGGIIKEIRVTEGQRVQAGDVLIRLSDTQAAANLQVLQGRYDALRARAARLTAERDRLAEVVFPSDLLARMSEPDVERLVVGQRDLFRARSEATESQLRVLRDRLKQNATQIEGIEAQRKSAQDQLGFVKEELDAARTLYEKGIYEKPRYLALQRTAADLRGRVGQHASSIVQTRERIGETESQIVEVQSRRMSEVSRELEEVQSSIFDAEDRLEAARDVLERTLVRAPSAGVIVALKFRTVGGVIPAGAPIMEVVPEDDELIVEIQVRTTDIDSVKIGLPADIRFTAFNQRTTPTLQGELTYVSADRTVDPQGQAYYLARVKVTDVKASSLPGGLSPGMPAEVHVVTGQRTPLQYLLKPLTDSLGRAGTEE